MTKPLAAHAGRILLTVAMLACALLLGHHMWDYYMNAPWTRDGRVRAEIVRIAPDVSGLVSEVLVEDNQRVRPGEVLFRIDPRRFELALRQAEADVADGAAALEMAVRDRERARQLINVAVSQQARERAETAVTRAEAAHDRARTALDVARLNLERAAVRAPVGGKITNFHLRRGDYVAAGAAVTALVDEASFYVLGYFEENKLDRIHPGDPARVRIMGDAGTLDGHVAGIAGGIEDRERSDSTSLLANVTPTFSWVRLAQRVPVRIALAGGEADGRLIAGRTASVEILAPARRQEAANRQP
ncbi:efflux RND transporter periplasmic adaptor subunit [Roseicella frigidaeris]|uniref:Efflux transporter periplasmic adaptor subunit n=1 Tax=Roseicella frigidaeris TaxID=2230885 RepID=A0A327MFW2_9PROT|nr:HlyD family secretion protein [Roseicella frigidaeris]RAI60944.1 efflux transporter periplasmic adaptor subunit [Roseicella frigidaeris]